MSMERCQACGCQIDTDFDDGCYLDDPRHNLQPHPDFILCRFCRDGWDDLEHDRDSAAQCAWEKHLEESNEHAR